MSDSIVCAVCGTSIAPHASRYVDVDPATKLKVHVDLKGKKRP